LPGLSRKLKRRGENSTVFASNQLRFNSDDAEKRSRDPENSTHGKARGFSPS
jgi:hypothetical protein